MKLKIQALCGLVFAVALAVSSATAQIDKPVKSTGLILNKKAVRLVTPDVPPAAKAVNASGTVNVQITIDEDGDVMSAEAVSGHPLLRAASEKAALNAKFTRALIEGKPVKVSGILLFTFASVRPNKQNEKTDTDIGKRENAEILNGKATKLPLPKYPAAAKAVRASGAVNVEATIDESGNTVAAEAVSGHPLLRSAAANAAREAKFEPTLVNGKAVKIKGMIVYNFSPPKNRE